MGTILFCFALALFVALNILLYVGYIVATRYFKRKAYCKKLKEKLKESAQ